MASSRAWSLSPPLNVGQRVKVIRDRAWAGPGPDEPTGVIEPIMGKAYRVVDLADDTINVPQSDRRLMREYLVHFDEPQRDSSNDGPFNAAVIWEKYVLVMDDVSPDSSLEMLELRARRDKALREVLDAPERGNPISQPDRPSS